MKSRSPGHSGQIWFVGGEGMVSFMTPDRAQLISSQPTGMTAATDTAVALFVAFR